MLSDRKLTDTLTVIIAFIFVERLDPLFYLVDGRK